MKDDQALRWLREASEAISRGHGVEANELLSEMVLALGKGGLSKIKSKGNAMQRARWCLADMARKELGRTGSRAVRESKAVRRGLYLAEQPRSAAPTQAAELADLSPLCARDQLIVRRFAEGATSAEIAVELGMSVHRRPTLDGEAMCRWNTTVSAHYKRALRRLEAARIVERRRADRGSRCA